MAEASPREVSARVLLRQDLAERHAALERELGRVAAEDLRENREPLALGVAQEIEALEAEMEACKRTFTFRSIGHRKWADLIAKHPPTRAQLAANSRLDHNPERFPCAAIAATCVSPEMTEEQAFELEGHLTLAQWSILWVSCLEANTGGGDSPKSQAAGAILRASGGSARTAAAMASLGASSSDGL